MPTLFFGVLVGLLAGTSAAPAGFVQALAPGAASGSAAAPRTPADRSGPAKADVTSQTAAPTPPTPTRDPETMRILAEARMHFDAGQDHYANQRYQEAIRSFQAGYALVPRPNFLVNIGQAYRKLGNLVRAKEAYVAYVRALPENSALRDQALQVLAEIEVQLHDGQPNAAMTSDVPLVAPVALQAAGVGLDQPARQSRAAVWVGAGLGGTGLGILAAGLGFQWRAKSASDALALSSQRGEPFDPEEERAGKRAERYGNRLLIAGGATMLAGLALYFIIDGVAEEPSTIVRGEGASAFSVSSSSSSSSTLSPSVSADRLGLSWRF